MLRRYALVLTRSGDEAEDLVQEALVRAIGGGAHVAAQPRGAARDCWPSSTTCTCRAGAGSRSRPLGRASRIQRHAAATPPAQYDHVQLGQTMAALMTLPDEQREVLVLVALDGLSYKDVAEILGLPHRHRDVAAGAGPRRPCAGPPATTGRRRPSARLCEW